MTQWSGKVNAWLDPEVVDSRNAIIAAKLENYIAPLLQKELGRKPRIIIQIGVGHADLVNYLKNPRERARALVRLRRKIESGLVKEHLDRSYRVRWDKEGGEMKIEEISTPITPLMREKRSGKVEPRRMNRRELFGRVFRAPPSRFRRPHRA